MRKVGSPIGQVELDGVFSSMLSKEFGVFCCRAFAWKMVALGIIYVPWSLMGGAAPPKHMKYLGTHFDHNSFWEPDMRVSLDSIK